MKKMLCLMATTWVLLSASVQANDQMNGRVTQYNTNTGIMNVGVRLVKLDGTQLSHAKTTRDGSYQLTYDENITQFHLRYDPPDGGSSGYYVAGRANVDRSGEKMDVDTMGLVSKKRTDAESSAKQQRDAVGYRAAGGDLGKTKAEIKFAKSAFGSVYGLTLSQQPLVKNWAQSLGLRFE